MPTGHSSRARPLLSVVTPAYNSARFLRGCIESVLAQTYPNVEHVVQDGASIDGSVEILKSYGERVAWESKPDAGQADGLDRAIKRSKGDYLLVLNADDELLPHAAEWAINQLDRFPGAAVVYGDVILIDEVGREIGEFHGAKYDFLEVLCVESVIPAQAAFIRRSALERVGLGTDPSLDTCPDFEMFVRLGLEFPMQHVPGFVTRYRYYPRLWDGSRPRSVTRFVDVKGEVIRRALQNPSAQFDRRGLARRAKMGLSLWASSEASQSGAFEDAWHYYADALRARSLILSPAAMIIEVILWLDRRLFARLSARSRTAGQRSGSRLMAAGAALFFKTVDSTSSSGAIARTGRALFRLSRPIVGYLTCLILLGLGALLLWLGAMEVITRVGLK